jgi:hypothetical protein
MNNESFRKKLDRIKLLPFEGKINENYYLAKEYNLGRYA